MKIILCFFAEKVKDNQELGITMGREVSLGMTPPDILETCHQLLEIKDQTFPLALTVVSACNFIVLGCQTKRLSSNVVVWLCKSGNLSFCLEMLCAWNQVMNWAELSLGKVITFLLSRSCVRRNVEALWLVAISQHSLFSCFMPRLHTQDISVCPQFLSSYEVLSHCLVSCYHCILLPLLQEGPCF